jgi:hypothetical protein
MIVWFAATAVAAVMYVFRDPRFDYRLLVVGSVLPLVDGLFGGARVLHSLSCSVALLAVVMLATQGRAIRATLLGVPIGTFLHLVFDGAWTDTTVFWWPFGGTSFDGAELFEVGRGWWSIALEAAGAALAWHLWRRCALHDRDRRRDFVRRGRLAASP